MKIKFRVWDKRNNRMIKPKKFATVIPVLDFNGNLGVMDTYKNWHWHGIVPENEYELMLFTGLQDKNGKEIYEGDICNCREYECFGKIEWNEDNAGFYFYVVVEGGGFDEERLYEYADELEVIGNIYENPELLEGN